MVLVGATSAGAASTGAAGGSFLRLGGISTGCVLGDDRLRRATAGLAAGGFALVEPAVLTARAPGGGPPRGARALLPEAATVIQEHDRLHLAVSTDRIGQVRRALSHAPTQEA